jgi:Tol biopolymer transport system component
LVAGRRSIVASVWTGNDFVIYVFDLPTGRRRPLPRDGQFHGESEPQWSPDGKRIAYAAQPGSLALQIYVTHAPHRTLAANQLLPGRLRRAILVA